jgi:hypothetical protein
LTRRARELNVQLHSFFRLDCELAQLIDFLVGQGIVSALEPARR